MLTKIFHLHALTALHVGVGQAIGVVDLPIARSRSTQLPLVPGSALKGVCRDEFAHSHRDPLFGPEKIASGESGYAGALAFGDAHLLIFPVRSFAGIVAYVTCPFVLSRYAEDCRRAGEAMLANVPPTLGQTIRLSETSVLRIKNDFVVLEDLDLNSEAGADEWAELLANRLFDKEEFRTEFKKRFAILSDDNFSFLAETATEIRARIRLNDETGVVEKGALWYEENLPAESVLWGTLAASRSRHKEQNMSPESVMGAFHGVMSNDKTIQIGGKSTVGRGLVRFII